MSPRKTTCLVTHWKDTQDPETVVLMAVVNDSERMHADLEEVKSHVLERST